MPSLEDLAGKLGVTILILQKPLHIFFCVWMMIFSLWFMLVSYHRWLGAGHTAKCLYDPRRETLEILFKKIFLDKSGPSGSAAVALALVEMVTGCAIIDNVLVVGQVDLRGRLLQVGGLAAKARAAVASSVTTMVIPADGEEEAMAEALQEGQAIPSLLEGSHRAKDMLDVLECVVPGESEGKDVGG